MKDNPLNQPFKSKITHLNQTLNAYYSAGQIVIMSEGSLVKEQQDG